MRAIVCVLALLVAAPAGADIFKLSGEVDGGGMGGKGTGGDQKNEAFFANAPHGMYGVRVAARFLILEAVIQHHQYRGGGELATWTSFLAGMGFGVDIGDDKQRKNHSSPFVELGGYIGGGLGTGRQVDPPLSNDEITDKAFLIDGRFVLGKHMGKIIDLGVALDGGWGYFLKNGVDVVANDVTKHYTGIWFEGMAFLRINIKLL